ncbi:Hypothetical predicted protein [Paramuricea clavata]|uniref:Bacterial Ig-like domain-containing protein n=2 Tax=Paramuricea clavata TaxID=317549 RepID=A0A7D9JFG5_PARCT|nr:Hypothetical predicted protein [Paramuricea clavata]
MENSFIEEDCGNGTNAKWTGNEIPDGPHKLMVYGVDKMNNRGPLAELQFNVDSTGPKISFPANQPVVTKNNPTFRWTSSEAAKFKCALDNGHVNELDCGDGTSSHWTGTNIPDGHYKLLVYGTDDMNNRGPTAEHKFIVDNSAPVVTFNRADNVTNDTPQFTWSSEEDVSQFLCSLDGAAYVNCGRGRTGDWSRNVPHGQHVFFVKGQDENGNVGTPAEHTFNVDTRHPNVVIEPIPLKTSNRSTSIRWTSDEPARYLCSIDNAPETNCGFGTNGQKTTSELKDGDHTFILTAIDPVGNRAPILRRRWTVDTTGPKISFPAGQPTLTRNNPTFRWTSSEPATFKCALDGGQFNVHDCGDGISGRWTRTDIPDGVYKLLVYGTDDTNNRGPTAEHKFVVDSRPPEITFSGDLPETTSRNPTLTWSSSEYATFECKLEDGKIFNCGSGDDGIWSGRNMTDGAHSLSVRGTDALGNKGQFISRSWTVDESGPRLRFVGDLPSRARRLPRIRWISNEFAFFECSLNGRNYTSCGRGMQHSWTRHETPTGLLVFRVRGRDTKGNVGEPITVAIDIGA